MKFSIGIETDSNDDKQVNVVLVDNRHPFPVSAIINRHIYDGSPENRKQQESELFKCYADKFATTEGQQAAATLFEKLYTDLATEVDEEKWGRVVDKDDSAEASS